MTKPTHARSRSNAVGNMSSRYIQFLLIALGLIASTAIYWSVLWLTSEINRIEVENSRTIMSFYLKNAVESAQAMNEDYSYLDQTHEIIAGRLDEKVEESLGSSAFEGHLFDHLYVLNAEGEVLFAFNSKKMYKSYQGFDGESFAPILETLHQAPSADYVSHAGFTAWHDDLALIAAAWVTPDNIADLPTDTDFAVLVMVHRFDQVHLVSIEDQTMLADFKLSPPSVQPKDRVALRLDSPSGSAAGWISWNTAEMGTMLRTQLLPYVALLCFGIFGICLSAAQYFHVQSKRLERAARIASTDQLTGLKNRAGLDMVLRSEAMKRAMSAGHVALIYLDLNDFKDLNDTHGHAAGDIALRVTAERLQIAIRASDHVVRLGGDEFLCMVCDPEADDAAQKIAETLAQVTQNPIQFNEHAQVIRSSIGMALIKPGLQWDTALSHADAAMYWAKRNRCIEPVMFCSSMHNDIVS